MGNVVPTIGLKTANNIFVYGSQVSLHVAHGYLPSTSRITALHTATNIECACSVEPTPINTEYTVTIIHTDILFGNWTLRYFHYHVYDIPDIEIPIILYEPASITFTVNKQQVLDGEDLTLSWNVPDAAFAQQQSWIGLYEPGNIDVAKHGERNHKYTGDTLAGHITFRISADDNFGLWHARYFGYGEYDWYAVTASASFTVVTNPDKKEPCVILTTDKPVYKTDEHVIVTWDSQQAVDDMVEGTWIGIFPASCASFSYHMWQYTQDLYEGSMQFPLGNMDFCGPFQARFFGDGESEHCFAKVDFIITHDNASKIWVQSSCVQKKSKILVNWQTNRKFQSDGHYLDIVKKNNQVEYQKRISVYGNIGEREITLNEFDVGEFVVCLLHKDADYFYPLCVASFAIVDKFFDTLAKNQGFVDIEIYRSKY
jgi:hypothetical protein